MSNMLNTRKMLVKISIKSWNTTINQQTSLFRTPHGSPIRNPKMFSIAWQCQAAWWFQPSWKMLRWVSWYHPNIGWKIEYLFDRTNYINHVDFGWLWWFADSLLEDSLLDQETQNLSAWLRYNPSSTCSNGMLHVAHWWWYYHESLRATYTNPPTNTGLIALIRL